MYNIFSSLKLIQIYYLQVENVLCQNIPLETILPEVSTKPQTGGNSKREVTQTQNPSKAQLINALFSYAAAKGLLPKTTEIIQSATLPQEQLQAASQKSLNTFNIVPLKPQILSGCEKKPLVPNTPAVSTIPIQNPVLPPITPSFPPYPTMQPTVRAEPFLTFSPTAYQVGCPENCPQPCQTLRIPSPALPAPGINCCPANQPVVYNEVIPPYPYLQFTPPNCATPINTECCIVENLCEADCGTLSEESLVIITDGKPGIPINLQINVPSPTDLYPSITIVTAPANPEPVVSTFPSYAYPPPLVMRRSRSCLRNLLPILLLALIDDCGCCGYGCNSNCDEPIPIPYPIPVPVNCPIVNPGCYSQCSPFNRR